MVNPAINHGLPAFLVEKGGLNSGFMIVQYSAAALVSENKVILLLSIPFQRQQTKKIMFLWDPLQRKNRRIF